MKTKTKLRIFAGFALSLASLTAIAVPVLQQGPGGEATGINGLVIGGSTYNVAFSEGDLAYSQVYGTPEFMGDPTGGEAARDAIIAALDSFGVTSVTDLVLNGGFFRVNVPVDISGGQAGDSVWSYAAIYDSSGWVPSLGMQSQAVDSAYQSVGWATFEQVPVPAPMALMGLGLIGVRLFKRRKA